MNGDTWLKGLKWNKCSDSCKRVASEFEAQRTTMKMDNIFQEAADLSTLQNHLMSSHDL